MTVRPAKKTVLRSVPAARPALFFFCAAAWGEEGQQKVIFSVTREQVPFLMHLMAVEEPVSMAVKLMREGKIRDPRENDPRLIEGGAPPSPELAPAVC